MESTEVYWIPLFEILEERGLEVRLMSPRHLKNVPGRKSALGAFFRGLRTRLGAPKAITATAHKIARLFYTIIRFGKNYEDSGAASYEKQYRVHIIKNMQHKAQKFGFSLVPIPSSIQAAAEVR